jgi:LysR family transcriptional regulator, carnitine catabolism transcriptional activator
MNAITIKQVQTFLAILQAGSFRAGSEKLHLSQPAVTAHIKQLELALGMPLLDRTTRRLSVTVAGERFRIRAEQALAELNSAVLELRDEAALKRGRISVACVPTIAAGMLPKALGRFAEKFPGITVKVYDVVAQQVLLQVAQSQADIGIGPRPLGRSEFDFHTVTRDPYVAVVPRRHPWAARKSVPLAALANTDFLTLLPGSHVRETLDAAMESQSLKLVPKFEVQHHYTLGGMVEAGLGVTALPSMAVSMLSQPLLRAVPIIRKSVAREVGIVKLRGKKLSPAAAVLINEFKDVVAENSSTKL